MCTLPQTIFHIILFYFGKQNIQIFPWMKFPKCILTHNHITLYIYHNAYIDYFQNTVCTPTLITKKLNMITSIFSSFDHLSYFGWLTYMLFILSIKVVILWFFLLIHSKDTHYKFMVLTYIIYLMCSLFICMNNIKFLPRGILHK